MNDKYQTAHSLPLAQGSNTPCIGLRPIALHLTHTFNYTWGNLFKPVHQQTRLVVGSKRKPVNPRRNLQIQREHVQTV